MRELEAFKALGEKELKWDGLYTLPKPTSPLSPTQLQELILTLHQRITTTTHASHRLQTDLRTEIQRRHDQHQSILKLEAGLEGLNREEVRRLEKDLERETRREWELVRTIEGVKERLQEKEGCISFNRANIQKSVSTRLSLASEVSDLTRYVHHTDSLVPSLSQLELSIKSLLTAYGQLQDHRFRLETRSHSLSHDLTEKSVHSLQLSHLQTTNSQLNTDLQRTFTSISTQNTHTSQLKTHLKTINEYIEGLKGKMEEVFRQRRGMEGGLEGMVERKRSAEGEIESAKRIAGQLEQKLWENEQENEKLVLQNRQLASQYTETTSQITSIQSNLQAFSIENAPKSPKNNTKKELEVLFRTKIQLKDDLQASNLHLEGLKSEISLIKTAEMEVKATFQRVERTTQELQACRQEIEGLKETKKQLLAEISSLSGL